MRYYLAAKSDKQDANLIYLLPNLASAPRCQEFEHPYDATCVQRFLRHCFG